jgi:hypothetical protein
MQGLWRREIIGVTALAANERVVLFTKHALADTKFDGSHPVSASIFNAYWPGSTDQAIKGI